ncbi:DUF2511 domain-containing protein [Nocardioides sp. SYSU D00065]|uniref:DUF2511 domain-containing protein n=1 Tax=Nocardioides sp. SYSU D00065 TaxID=2817378 RepID=UPI001B335E3D|nr:DUF2511 domain-containing protein [Nocardioides sp. SYSU D00065]
MHRLLVAIASIAFLGACSSPDKGFGESEEIGRSELGSEWPLNVDSALLTCLEGDVSVTIAGRTDYIDTDVELQDLSRRFRRAWSHDPLRPDSRMSLRPLVDRGKSLCD